VRGPDGEKIDGLREGADHISSLKERRAGTAGEPTVTTIKDPHTEKRPFAAWKNGQEVPSTSPKKETRKISVRPEMPTSCKEISLEF